MSAPSPSPGRVRARSSSRSEDSASRTTRRLVRVLSLAMSSSRGRVWSGGFERSGMGQSRMVLSLPPVAIQRPSGEKATGRDGPSCPSSRWGSSPSPGRHGRLPRSSAESTISPAAWSQARPTMTGRAHQASDSGCRGSGSRMGCVRGSLRKQQDLAAVRIEFTQTNRSAPEAEKANSSEMRGGSSSRPSVGALDPLRPEVAVVRELETPDCFHRRHPGPAPRPTPGPRREQVPPPEYCRRTRRPRGCDPGPRRPETSVNPASSRDGPPSRGRPGPALLAPVTAKDPSGAIASRPWSVARPSPR